MQFRPYLAQHTLPMLLAAIASAALTAVAIFGAQAMLRRAETNGKDLQAKLLGKWELIEPLSDGIDQGEIWLVVRPDQTIQWCTMSTVHIDGKLSSKSPQLRTYEYRATDGAHLVLDPGRDSQHTMRVILNDDGLTLFKQYGQVERYRRAASP
jgi:hypothetical protein